MLDQFHARHPNIRVFYTPDPSDLNEQMLADFQAGTAPDVLSGCCEFFPVWAQKGYLLDLRPYVDADLERTSLDDWDRAQYHALFAADGSQFALPKYHGALALYYNKDWFDEAGLPYPDGSWDHADYQQAMKQLVGAPRAPTTRWGSMVDIAWDRLQVHVNGWGGHLVDPQNPYRSMIARPEALAAMQWIRDRMWEDHTMASFLDVKNQETRQVFIQERIAMVEDGSWSLKDILEHAQFRVGVAPFPAGPSRKVTLATTDGYAIYAGTKFPDAAWDLLKFLTGMEYGRALAHDHLLQPARASLIDEWVAAIRDEYPAQTTEMDINAFAEGHLQGYSVVAEVFANMEEARELVLSAWERIFTLGQAPVELMTEVSTQVENLQRAAA